MKNMCPVLFGTDVANEKDNLSETQNNLGALIITSIQYNLFYCTILEHLV